MKFKNYNCRNCVSRERLKHRIIRDIKEENLEIVNLFDASEITINWITPHVFRTAVRQHNVHVNYLFGSIDQSYYKRFNYFEGSVYTWPTYFFKETYLDQVSTSNQLFYARPNKFKYAIMCLNKMIHVHRYRMLKELEERNLLEGNAVSWLGERGWIDGYHFNNQGIAIEDMLAVPVRTLTESESFNELGVPEEWNESFLHIVCESTIEVRYLTEKTIKCLFGSNLFIVWGAPLIHTWLEEQGFQLYYEIIDYSFDKELDHQKRLKMIIAEVEKVIALDDYSNVYNQLRNKLEHNRNRAIEIALDGQGPSLITEFDFHEYDRYLNITRSH